jgi:hypothetical protein
MLDLLHPGGAQLGSFGEAVVGALGLTPDLDEKVADLPQGKRRLVAIARVAACGGAKVAAFNGPDYTDFGCGPAQALDLSLTTGWGSTTGNNKGTPTNVFVPKFITVDMGRRINITSFAVDPSATCGDADSASTGAYRIETSPDNVTWTVAASGTFDETHRHKLNTVTPTQGTAGVQFVKFTILGNQVPDFATNCPNGGFSGCSFTDLTELQVYGVPTP